MENMLNTTFSHISPNINMVRAAQWEGTLHSESEGSQIEPQ